MQPLSGLHIASLIDRSSFDVELYHEDWHGPYNTLQRSDYDLVFLTGLQADFDRMRQLSFHFRREGAVVIAGGSICTLFPEFASQFFDAVCAGGVDAVPLVVADALNGKLKPIYRSASHQISKFALDYSLLAKSGIHPPAHLIEASRGCSFRCSFCVIPAEGAKHASYDIEILKQTIDNAIDTSPLWSFRRWYPAIFFFDNNFADDRRTMLQVADMLSEHPRLRAWAALVTQDVLHDRELVRQLSRRKCRALFVGLESLDREFLRRYNKTQNLSRRGDIVADILYAETQGIFISYGCLLDPRLATAAEYRDQVEALLDVPGFPAPTYFSLIAPLAGTATFWNDVENGELLPNLTLRDLEGETIAYRQLKDSIENVAELADHMSRQPWRLVPWRKMLASTLRRIVRSGRLDPVHWYMIAATNLHSYWFAHGASALRKLYLPGDLMDPQYAEFPGDISAADRAKYFEPIRVTDEDGRLAEWLRPYQARRRKSNSERSTRRSAQASLENQITLDAGLGPGAN